jgi:ferrous iron transport protein B
MMVDNGMRSDKNVIRVALAGNPNSGKTSLFNCLTGATQKVGNWSGVTVDIVEGSLRSGNTQLVITDLPGTYSLSTCSADEQVARQFITEKNPDVVVNVIDATNLERHLYLTVQLLELGIRPVLALNMWDEVMQKGITIDCKRLSELLGLPVVKTNSRSNLGMKDLTDAIIDHASKTGIQHSFTVNYPVELESVIDALVVKIRQIKPDDKNPRYDAIQLFESDKEVAKKILEVPGGGSILEQCGKYIDDVEKKLGDTPESFIVEARYGYISGICRETVNLTKVDRVQMSDKIDTVLTHRFWAYPVFIVFMWLLFQATFKLGEIPMSWIESLFRWLGVIVAANLPQGVFRDLLVDGVIAGVGGVIVFLPNILILFLGISIMEDTGYMARAAFIMDKMMHRIGLHGKSFIPMLMGLGCSVPAIMAARTLESPKDRIKTILLTPLISCSARLPVFVLFAGALFPKHAGNVVFLFQVLFGFGAFIMMGFLFKHTLFKKTEDYPFVMELPPYRLPTLRSILIHMWHKTEHYLKKMGGVVLAFSVILWWAGTFPNNPDIDKKYNEKIAAVESDKSIDAVGKAAVVSEIEKEYHAERMAQTYIGKVGKFIEPVVTPFGTDWRGAVSLVTGFVAKEVVVSSMGVLYAAGDGASVKSDGLRAVIRNNFTPLSGFAFMLFVLLYTPCVVALITAVRELGNWKWSVFSVCYQLCLAWTAATLVYQIGRLFIH